MSRYAAGEALRQLLSKAALTAMLPTLVECAAPLPQPLEPPSPSASASVAPTAAAGVDPGKPDARLSEGAPSQGAPESDPCAQARAALATARQRSNDMSDCTGAFEAMTELHRCQEGAEPEDREERTRELQGLHDECAEKVALRDYGKLSASLSPAQATQQRAAAQRLSGAVAGFCPRCDPTWGLYCAGAVFDWVDERVLAAMQGTLALEPAPKPKAKPDVPPARAGKRGDAVAVAFGDLARAICALPSAAWKAHRPPPRCEAVVVDQLHRALPALPFPSSSSPTCNFDAPNRVP